MRSETAEGEARSMGQVAGLNHAVLFVRDLMRSLRFYREVLGLELVEEVQGRAAFLRAPGSSRHHELGLVEVGGAAAASPPGAVGLYHLAWEVASIEELAALRDELVQVGAYVGASDHGVSKSVYARDPDGIELEVMWPLPREEWGEMEHRQLVDPLDLEAELARWGGQERQGDQQGVPGS
jgi:catechol-2,3-dioxygenase